jgi:hypothetical protein
LRVLGIPENVSEMVNTESETVHSLAQALPGTQVFLKDRVFDLIGMKVGRACDITESEV